MEKTIVLLHGFGEDNSIFDSILPTLRENYTVIVPNFPGSGELVKHHWLPKEQSIEWLADWVADFLQENKLRKVAMLGHSMGGYITLAFAEKYPEQLSAFGLLHSTAFADSKVKKETRLKAVLFMKKKGGFTFLKTAIPGLFATGFANKSPGLIDDLIQKAKSFETKTLIAYYEAMLHRPDRTAVLRNAQVPVLIIAGEEDPAVPLKDQLQQAAFPPVCHFFTLKQVGHMGMLEDPSGFLKAIVSFIQANG